MSSHYLKLILFAMLFVVLIILVGWGSIISFIFPIFLWVRKQWDSFYYVGILGACLNAIFCLLQPQLVSLENTLVSTLIYLMVALFAYDKQVANDVSETNATALRNQVNSLDAQLNTIKFALPDRAFIFDKDGYYIDVLSQLIAPEVRERIIGQHVSTASKTISPETAQSILEVIRKTIETGESQRLEYQAFTSNDKMWSWLEGRSALIQSAETEEQHVILVSRDITDRKQLEASLETVQELASIGTWSTDVAKNYVEWSDEMYRIYGIDEKDFKHTVEDAMSYIHPDDLPAFRKRFPTRTNIYPTEYRIVRPDGTVRNVFAVGDRIVNEEGELIKRVGLLQDITERKKAELERTQLQIEQQRSSTLRNLINNVTHDIMTPLTAIKTKLYLIHNTKDDERRTTHIDQANAQIDLLEKLFNNLLMVSYLNNVGLDQLARNQTNIVDTVKNLAIQYQSLMGEKKQTLVTTLPDNPIFLTVDVNYIWRAIAGLLQNALQYTPEGGQIKLMIRSDDKQVYITVTDNGVGIPPEDQARIFEQFYRVAEHRPSNGSSGLGLSITKTVIELHGGTITVDSKPNEGSSFCVTLPKI